jgi:hypothetical protein
MQALRSFGSASHPSEPILDNQAPEVLIYFCLRVSAAGSNMVVLSWQFLPFCQFNVVDTERESHPLHKQDTEKLGAGRFPDKDHANSFHLRTLLNSSRILIAVKMPLWPIGKLNPERQMRPRRPVIAEFFNALG